ncbi:MAG: hypothetical protein KDD94_05150 [Calditrichaeota bacterium]|nr:hypothetical protein [Calditrichota bacterium]
MAKKQTFGDKSALKQAAKNSVKIVVSERSPKSGKWRFSEKMIQVPPGENFETYADQIVKGQ